MEICIVSPYSWIYPGGVNNHIKDLSDQLIKRGHRVSILAPDIDRMYSGEKEAAGIKGLEYIDAGRSVPIPANGSTARLALGPGTGGRVRDALRSRRFDVVHVHEPFVPSVSISAVRLAECRVVATFHAARDGGYFPYRLASNTLKNVSAKLDCRITVSEASMELASRYLPGEFELIPNGIDLSRFKPLEKDGGRSAEKKPVILFVGRDEPRKGLSTLLEAFEKIAPKVPEWELLLAGFGISREKIDSRVSETIRKRIKVAGYVEKEELPGLYAGAGIFCAPAVGGESFGIVLLEAMASGTAVVASDIPGYRKVIDSAGGGVVFKSGDPGDLAEKLIELVNDDNQRYELIQRGLKGVREFSWELLAAMIERCYRGNHNQA